MSPTEVGIPPTVKAGVSPPRVLAERLSQSVAASAAVSR